MNVVHTCIVCDNPDLTRIQTRISPFLREYVWNNLGPIDCNFVVCTNCSAAFYDARPDTTDMTRLYSGYRGEAYSRVRDSHEPGYSAMNGKIGVGREIDERRGNLDRLLRDRVSTRFVRSVLDFGGDAGQFIPSCLDASKKYVYDLSGSPTVCGALPIADPARHAPYDFIMCCHMLEHVPDPQALAGELSRLVARSGIIYFEVPWEPLYFDQRLSSLIHWSPPPMHEHINFFSAAALHFLIERAGLHVSHWEIQALDFGWTKANILSVLAEGHGTRRPLARRSATILALEFVRWSTIRIRDRVRRARLLSPAGD